MKLKFKSIAAVALCAVGLAAFAELTGLPLEVKNVKSQQRYPWNGLVDVSCDLTGSGTVTLGVTVLTNDVKFIKKPTIIGETTVDLDAVGGVTNGVKFVWNAAKDLPAGFKVQNAKVKLLVSPVEVD